MGDQHNQSESGPDDSNPSHDDNRREVVEHARRLIADPNYPDHSTREKIARLLADKLDAANPEFPDPPSS